MENAGVQKKRTGQTPSVGRWMWDPFGFVQDMFGWGRSAYEPLFEVRETDDTYVCKVKVQLTLPDQADVAHAKAEIDRGELTLVVPKTAAAKPEPMPAPQTSGAKPEPSSVPRSTRGVKESGKGGGSARQQRRRAARNPARRG